MTAILAVRDRSLVDAAVESTSVQTPTIQRELFRASIMAFGKIPELNINEPDTWSHYEIRFAFFVEANKITLDTHFDPKKNEIAACFVFANRRQQHTEIISEFVVELKRLSRGYNFQDFDKQLLIWLVCGVKYERLQYQLLSETDLTLDKAVKLALAFEAAKKNIETNLTSNSEVKQVTGGTAREVQGCEYMSFHKESNLKPENSRSAVLLVKCYRCGAAGHKAPVCRHTATVCSQCHKFRYLERVCRSTTENKVSQAEVCSMNKNITELEKLVTEGRYEKFYNVIIRGQSTQPYRTKVQLNGKLCDFEVHSGAGLTIV
ncbi:hypothetical protein PR048_020816 [Dryococelus australis]|uniref:CCHC-type domain-containing protein n=1 Tax=Dryococelus australis TaxID=614101 RepID=A0ABQ9GWG4_9NEOP|nr:hypothetical protein PR048_020816 [Dryococelus australis]